MVLDYAGIQASHLEAPARCRLPDLVHLYVSNMDDGHGRAKMDEVSRHIENTWFAWRGGTEADSVFNYRVMIPVIFVNVHKSGL